MITKAVKTEDARKLAVTLIEECDPESLAEFLDKYLDDSGIGFSVCGDGFLLAYMENKNEQELLNELLENDSNDFSAYKNGEDFTREFLEDEKKEKRRELPFPECFKYCLAVELLGVGECENVCPEKFKEKNDD